MPIYEYGCDKCGTFEVSQRITDKPLRRCPTCKGKVRKLISSTSFHLKGSGWYVTDYAGKGGSKAKEEGKESGKDAGKDAGKSDAADASKESSSETSKTSTDAPAKESSTPSSKKADGKKTEATAA